MNLNQIFDDLTKKEQKLEISNLENYKKWCVSHWNNHSSNILLFLKEKNTEDVDSYIYISIDEMSGSPFSSIPPLCKSMHPSYQHMEDKIDCYLTALNIEHSMRVVSDNVTGVYISKTAELPTFTEIPE